MSDFQNAIRKTFRAKHSKLGQPVAYGSWLLFPNGAIMEESPHGICREPPTDDKERLTLVVHYYEKATAYEEQAHERLRHRFIATFDLDNPDAKSYSGVLFNISEDQAMAVIDEAGVRVIAHRELLNKAKGALKKLTHRKESKEQRQMQAEFDEVERHKEVRRDKFIKRSRL